MTEKLLNIENNIENSDEKSITFTYGGLLQGVRQSLLVALSVFTYGLVFGVLAQQVGLSLVEALLMSGLVFAGSSQFAVMGLWTYPLPILTIVLTTLVVNLRHLLMGAAIGPFMRPLKIWQRYLSLFFLNDESWALTMSQFAKGKKNGAFLLGSGLTLFVAWTGSTAAGRWLGTVIKDPSSWGLDFAFPAVFIALLVGLWKGKADGLPWVVAGIVAMAASWWLPGKWYILLGGLVGSFVGAWRSGD